MDEVNYPHALIVCGYDPVFKSLHVDVFRNNGNTYFIKFEVHSIFQIDIEYIHLLSCCNSDGLPVSHIFGGYCLMPGQWSMFIMLFGVFLKRSSLSVQNSTIKKEL